MSLVARTVFRRWLPLASTATGLCLLVYVAVQQAHRTSANDPQIQLAEDAVRALEGGASVESVLPQTRVDLERGLAPFVVVYDGQGQPLAGSGTLRGQLPSPPRGVFEFVRAHGEERVTLQPERGVRIASVVRRANASSAGYVLVGRSLREVEERESQLRLLCALALAAVLAGTLLVVVLSEALLGARS